MNQKITHFLFVAFTLASLFSCSSNDADIVEPDTVDREGNYSGKMYVHTDTVYMDNNFNLHYDFWDDTLMSTITVNYVGSDSISFSNEPNAIFPSNQEEEYSDSSGVNAPVIRSTWYFSGDTLIYFYSYGSISGFVTKNFKGIK